MQPGHHPFDRHRCQLPAPGPGIERQPVRPGDGRRQRQQQRRRRHDETDPGNREEIDQRTDDTGRSEQQHGQWQQRDRRGPLTAEVAAQMATQIAAELAAEAVTRAHTGSPVPSLGQSAAGRPRHLDSAARGLPDDREHGTERKPEAGRRHGPGIEHEDGQRRRHRRRDRSAGPRRGRHQACEQQHPAGSLRCYAPARQQRIGEGEGHRRHQHDPLPADPPRQCPDR